MAIAVGFFKCDICGNEDTMSIPVGLYKIKCSMTYDLEHPDNARLKEYIGPYKGGWLCTGTYRLRDPRLGTLIEPTIELTVERKRYEHKVEPFCDTIHELEYFLNAMGRDGWRLICDIDGHHEIKRHYIFIREVIDD